METRALFTALALSVFVSSPASPLDRGKSLTQYVLESWGAKDGLRQHRVRAITQTQDGYLWLATESGLVRFDGVRFTTFGSKNTPGFGHDYLYALAEGDDGSLWIGTYHGLTRMKGGVFTTYTDRDGLSDSYVWCLGRSRDGVWVGGWKGLSRFAGGRFTVHPRFKGQSIRTVLEARDGSLWVGVGRNLHHLAGDRETVYSARDGLPRDVRFTALLEASSGGLWIGSEQGLAHLADGALRLYSTRDGLADDNVQSLREDAEGTLWIGTSAGLSRFDGKTFSNLPRGLSDDAVSAIQEDREGSLWIGTPGGGLNRLKDGRFTPYGRPEGLGEHTVWAVYQSPDGAMWMGTDGGGVSRLKDGRLSRYTARDGLPDDIAFTLAASRDGGLWIGMNTGLGRWKDGRVATVPTPGLTSPSIRAVFEDSRGQLWLGTSTGGLYRREGAAFVSVRPGAVSEEHVYVSSILEARDGSLWFGTDAGLWRQHDGELTVYTKKNGLPGDYAAGIYEQADGTIWVGTNPGGLARWKEGRWVILPPEADLIDANVNAMVEDARGRVWFTTDRAIYSAAMKDLEDALAGAARAVPCQGFDSHDGLRVAEGSSGFPSAWKGADGRLWFATSRGAAVVDPQNLRNNPIPPPVYVESVTVDGAPVKFADGVEAAPGRGELEILYTAPSLRVPERVRFKYKLEGFDAQWVDAASRRTAYYTNIPPGSYRFRVVASNDDGVWNETGASLPIHLRPHFYQTRWFLGAWVALLVLGGVGVHRLRVRHLEHRETELVHRVDEALAQIKVLSGLLPICASCNQIRDDSGSWNRIESYIESRTTTTFSHSICPECLKKLYPEYADSQRRQT